MQASYFIWCSAEETEICSNTRGKTDCADLLNVAENASQFPSAPSSIAIKNLDFPVGTLSPG